MDQAAHKKSVGTSCSNFDQREGKSIVRTMAALASFVQSQIAFASLAVRADNCSGHVLVREHEDLPMIVKMKSSEERRQDRHYEEKDELSFSFLLPSFQKNRIPLRAKRPTSETRIVGGGCHTKHNRPFARGSGIRSAPLLQSRWDETKTKTISASSRNYQLDLGVKKDGTAGGKNSSSLEEEARTRFQSPHPSSSSSSLSPPTRPRRRASFSSSSPPPSQQRQMVASVAA